MPTGQGVWGSGEALDLYRKTRCRKEDKGKPGARAIADFARKQFGLDITILEFVPKEDSSTDMEQVRQAEAKLGRQTLPLHHRSALSLA